MIKIAVVHGNKVAFYNTCGNLKTLSQFLIAHLWYIEETLPFTIPGRNFNNTCRRSTSMLFNKLFAEGEVNIGECLPSRRRDNIRQFLLSLRQIIVIV